MKIRRVIIPLLLGLASCTVQEPSQEVGITAKPVKVSFTAEVGTDTKTAFAQSEGNTFHTLWTENDTTIAVSLNFASPQIAEITSEPGSATASFEAGIDFSQASAPYTIRAMSPEGASLQTADGAWTFYIPTGQTPLPGSPDEEAQILAAVSESYDSEPSTVSLHFSHLTAYGCLTINNLPEWLGDVSSILLMCSTPIAGLWSWTGAGTAVDAVNASSEIILNTSSTSSVWFACAPADLSGAIFSVTVNAAHGTAVKSITMPQGRAFTAGRAAIFSVDFTDAQTSVEMSYKLVRKASSLEAGDKLIITSESNLYAMAEIAPKGNYRNATSAEVNGDFLVQTDKMTVLTLGGSEGAWTLFDGSGYLSASTGNYNYLTNLPAGTGAAVWSISISAGIATIKSNPATRGYLAYNSQKLSERFACYAEYSATQEHVRIYKLTDPSIPDLPDAMVTYTVPGSYFKKYKRIYTPGEDQIIRMYNGEALTFVIANPDTYEQLSISGYNTSMQPGETVTVQFTYRTGTKEHASLTYTLDIIKDEDGLVTLSNGDGEGFIIKK